MNLSTGHDPNSHRASADRPTNNQPAQPYRHDLGEDCACDTCRFTADAYIYEGGTPSPAETPPPPSCWGYTHPDMPGCPVHGDPHPPPPRHTDPPHPVWPAHP